MLPTNQEQEFEKEFEEELAKENTATTEMTKEEVDQAIDESLQEDEEPKQPTITSIKFPKQGTAGNLRHNQLLNVRTGPSLTSGIYGTVEAGKVFTLVGEEESFYKIALKADLNGKPLKDILEVYVAKEFIVL